MTEITTQAGDFFTAALELSNALGLLASGDLDVGNLDHRLTLRRAFGKAQKELDAARRQFFRVCIAARLEVGC